MSNQLITPSDSATSRGRGGRTVFTLLAVASLAIAAAIFWFGSDLGLEPEVANLIAFAFFIVALCDLAILLAWRRIFQTMP